MQYRGKVRWLHENEMFRELNMDNQKSPEIVSYYMMMTGKLPYPVDSYDGLTPEIFIFGNLVEINDNVFVGSGSTIYHETVESAGFTISSNISPEIKIISLSLSSITLPTVQFQKKIFSIFSSIKCFYK